SVVGGDGTRALTREEVTKFEPKRTNDLLRGATGEALEQDPAVVALADRKAGVAVFVGGTLRDPAAAAALHALKPVEKLGRVHGREEAVSPGKRDPRVEGREAGALPASLLIGRQRISTASRSGFECPSGRYVDLRMFEGWASSTNSAACSGL